MKGRTRSAWVGFTVSGEDGVVVAHVFAAGLHRPHLIEDLVVWSRFAAAMEKPLPFWLPFSWPTTPPFLAIYDKRRPVAFMTGRLRKTTQSADE